MADSWTEIWPYLGSDNQIYPIRFNLNDIRTASYPKTKCVFINKHNSVVFPNGLNIFPMSFNFGPQVSMILK